MGRKIQVPYAILLSSVVGVSAAFAVIRGSKSEAATGVATPAQQSLGKPQYRLNTDVATGEVKKRYFTHVVDGRAWSLVRFVNELGQVCAGERRSTADGEWGQGLSCRDPATLFARAPLTYFVGSERESNTSPQWETAWVWGWASPDVRRLELVMSDCSRVALAVNSDRLFFHVIGSASLRAGLAPTRLDAYDASGARVADEPAPLLDPVTERVDRDSTTCR